MNEISVCLYVKLGNKQAYLLFGDIKYGDLVRFVNRPSWKASRAFGEYERPAVEEHENSGIFGLCER